MSEDVECSEKSRHDRMIQVPYALCSGLKCL